jgi:hypothetical protein
MHGVTGERERNFIPAEQWVPHVDRDGIVLIFAATEKPAIGTKNHFGHAQRAHQYGCDSSSGAAAGAEGRSVRIPEDQPRRGIVAFEENDELIETNTAISVSQTPRNPGVKQTVAASCVNHDKVIAVGVHLNEL